MKTVKDLDKMIEECMNDPCHYDETKKGKSNRIKNKMEFYKTIRLYLETNPSIEFLEKDRERMLNRTAAIKHAYTPPDRPNKSHKSAYLKEMGVTELKRKIRTIDFILSDN